MTTTTAATTATYTSTTAGAQKFSSGQNRFWGTQRRYLRPPGGHREVFSQRMVPDGYSDLCARTLSLVYLALCIKRKMGAFSLYHSIVNPTCHRIGSLTLWCS